MDRIHVRFATLRDDEAIRALLRRNPMPGRISLCCTSDPDFFASIRPLGCDPVAIVAESGGTVFGVGVCAYRRVFINGRSMEVGYLSVLRVDAAFRGTTALARGYRLFGRMHRVEGRVPFYLSTIMEDNGAARSLLASPRPNMPVYHDIGGYETAVIPLVRRTGLRKRGDVRILRGSDVGAGTIAACLRSNGPRRQFYPDHSAGGSVPDPGLPYGLRPADFVVAVGGGRVVGVLACQDQAAFRRYVVHGYSGAVRLFRPLANLVAPLFGWTPLPDPGMPVGVLFAACVAVDGDDAAVFRLLLGRALADAAGAGFLAVGLSERDPLLRAVRGWSRVTLRSRIYAVAWPDGEGSVRELDGRAPYFEPGSL